MCEFYSFSFFFLPLLKALLNQHGFFPSNRRNEKKKKNKPQVYNFVLINDWEI